MSIELTKDQQQALDAEKSMPRVIDPRTGAAYVLIPAAEYERLRSLAEDDLPPEDAFRAQIESAAAAGWDDPALDVYNDLDPRNRP